MYLRCRHMARFQWAQAIPNGLTLCNLSAGCVGLIFCLGDSVVPYQWQATDSHPGHVTAVFGVDSKLYLAGIMVYVAAVFDFLDGLVARWLKATSALGKQLDALADVISFGVLPACIFFRLLEAAWARQPEAFSVPLMASLPALVLAWGAAWRLARFTITQPANHFQGLPTPAMALFAASLPLVVFTDAYQLGQWVLNRWVLYAAVCLFTWLMVARMPMFSLRPQPGRWMYDTSRIVFLVVAAIIIGTMAYAGIAIVVLIYILINTVFYFLRKKIL